MRNLKKIIILDDFIEQNYLKNFTDTEMYRYIFCNVYIPDLIDVSINGFVEDAINEKCI